MIDRLSPLTRHGITHNEYFGFWMCVPRQVQHSLQDTYMRLDATHNRRRMMKVQGQGAHH